MERIRSRLSYANVMATVAVFLALGGGAYALSGIPDRGGVFHGCVSNKTGVLRVVKSASACHRVRGSGKHRDPGEFAIAWNQQGRPGINGVNGTNGTNGSPGAPGTVRAYALVNPSLCTGTPTVCTFEDAKGISSVTRVSTGLYCIEAPGISASNEDPIVTTEYDTTTSPESVPLALADSVQGASGCGSNKTGFKVITKRPSAFDTDATTNDVGFVVAIP
jgi:hypothetical protein